MSTFVVLQRLCYLLLAVLITRTQAQSSSSCQHDKLFDFEESTPGQESCFQTPSTSGSVTLSTDPSTVKYGIKSLKWTATVGSTLQLKSPEFTIPSHGRWLRHGGVKIWIYKDSPSPQKLLKVEFQHVDKKTSTTVARFSANLNFAGWRGIWVKFEECKLTKTSLNNNAKINEVNFVLTDADTIYIDALKFEGNLAKQSRDKIVPPIPPFGLDLYDKSKFWQQSHKWSKQDVPKEPPTIDEDKRKSLDHIKSRLKNFYCDETKTTSTLSGFEKARWDSLLGDVEKAYTKYEKNLISHEGRIVGPGLFCRNCKLKPHFVFVFHEILKPLALEYHIRSRTNEVTDAATKQLDKLNSGDKGRLQNAQIAIAGKDSNMQRLFTSYLPSERPLTKEQVVPAIDKLNDARLSKINDLFDYLTRQGFADGSGLGSLDHEMNRDGAGFMHTLFLISDSLSSPSSKCRLLDLIKTAKWYNDFGELYQTKFEFKGTTADRMITIMLYRLMIVLVMPSDNDDEVKAKIRDMDALLKWMNNALSINEGLGGVIKPDFTGFHHKGFYASAYAPQALHTAAFVEYLLGGTAFALSQSSTNNIRRAMETMRTVAVKYSTPPGVNGRYPEYDDKDLIKSLLAAYAYISVSHPSPLPSTVPTGISFSNLKKEEAQMFLRLFDEDDKAVKRYLKNGRPSKKKYYFNTLGSLQIMNAVKSTAETKGITAESSPEGHWSKNFAALSIHRREDWAVTVKGFNRFVWDVETSKTENLYGLFASHGALLIANSEADLEVHDIEKGWDWSKVPGTTTINMGNDELNIGRGRFYNKAKLAGSLTFQGKMCQKNGLFGMNFLQPNYGLSDWRKNIRFRFKKSVFSFENLLVCLGSNIVVGKSGGKKAQTTLFQDKLGVASSFIKVDGVQKKSSSDLIHVPSSTSHTTLTDAKGNFYYVPDPSKKKLKVTVKTQNSKSHDGKTDTSGTYGTAWLEHEPRTKKEKNSPSYQYAVLIPTASYHTPLTDLATAQENEGDELYKVLKNNRKAHVVQFVKSPKTWSALSAPVTGYVIFDDDQELPTDGPVERVSGSNSLIMAQETKESVHLSVCYPDLDFTDKDLDNSGNVGEDLLYKSSSREKSVTVTLKNKVATTIASIQVHGTPTDYTPNVEIESNGKEIRFKNLKNGFSVEVELTRETQT